MNREAFLHFKTPTYESIPLSRYSGKKIYLKMECYQPTGAFKIRGIGLLCQEHVSNGIKELVSSSGGNAGYATAYCGRKLGVKVKVFVPNQTQPSIIESLKDIGADVFVVGNSLDGAGIAAREYASEVGGGYVPPFDHPTIWRGHSTMIDEVSEQIEKPDAIILSIGGGGLLCGVMQGLERLKWDIPVFCAETMGAESFSRSLMAGEIVTLDKITSIAVTLGARRIAEEAFSWAIKKDVRSIVLSDYQAVKASRQFLDDHNVLVEPACGVSLASIYEKLIELEEFNVILVIVCGGITVKLDRLLAFMHQ